MHVASKRSLRGSLAEDVRVTRIQAIDPGSLVACGERRDQMIFQANQKDVTPKWRTVFFANHGLDSRLSARNRMLAAAGNKILPVEYAIILVGNQLIEHALVFGFGHHDQVGK